MWQAREKIMLKAPENFKISLSTYYNYTMNYRENSRAAKQHQHGKNRNAPRSNTIFYENFFRAFQVDLFKIHSKNNGLTLIKIVFFKIFDFI